MVLWSIEPLRANISKTGAVSDSLKFSFLVIGYMKDLYEKGKIPKLHCLNINNDGIRLC